MEDTFQIIISPSEDTSRYGERPIIAGEERVKRRRGRPRQGQKPYMMDDTFQLPNPSTNFTENQGLPIVVKADGEQVKRGRGRPRKIINKHQMNETDKLLSTSEESNQYGGQPIKTDGKRNKKRRGRPRKLENPSTHSTLNFLFTDKMDKTNKLLSPSEETTRYGEKSVKADEERVKRGKLVKRDRQTKWEKLLQEFEMKVEYTDEIPEKKKKGRTKKEEEQRIKLASIKKKIRNRMLLNPSDRKWIKKYSKKKLISPTSGSLEIKITDSFTLADSLNFSCLCSEDAESDKSVSHSPQEMDSSDNLLNESDLQLAENYLQCPGDNELNLDETSKCSDITSMSTDATFESTNWITSQYSVPSENIDDSPTVASQGIAVQCLPSKMHSGDLSVQKLQTELAKERTKSVAYSELTSELQPKSTTELIDRAVTIPRIENKSIQFTSENETLNSLDESSLDVQIQMEAKELYDTSRPYFSSLQHKVTTSDDIINLNFLEMAAEVIPKVKHKSKMIPKPVGSILEVDLDLIPIVIAQPNSTNELYETAIPAVTYLNSGQSLTKSNNEDISKLESNPLSKVLGKGFLDRFSLQEKLSTRATLLEEKDDMSEYSMPLVKRTKGTNCEETSQSSYTNYVPFSSTNELNIIGTTRHVEPDYVNSENADLNSTEKSLLDVQIQIKAKELYDATRPYFSRLRRPYFKKLTGAAQVTTPDDLINLKFLEMAAEVIPKFNKVSTPFVSHLNVKDVNDVDIIPTEITQLESVDQLKENHTMTTPAVTNVNSGPSNTK